MNERSEQDNVSEILARMTDLPSVPAVALEILRMTEDDSCTIDDLAAALSLDPALAGKVMSLANSTAYTIGNPVSTLQSAMMRLGTRTVKLMSLTFSLAGSLPVLGSGPFDLRQYWRRSILCGVAARALAQRQQSQLVDEAFLCGLLSRIGQLVLGHCLPDAYADVVNAAAGEWPRSEHEQKVFGCDGSEIAASLLRSWSLPEFVCDAISHAPDPSGIPEGACEQARSLARIIHSASQIETLFCSEVHGSTLTQLIADWCGDDRMDVEQLSSFIEELEPAFEETARMLDVEIGPIDSDKIVASARQLMVNESLGIAFDAQVAQQQAAQLADQNQTLNTMASTDALTQLPNRACFDEMLRRSVSDRRNGDIDSLGLLFIDVDHFKGFNDNYGHQAGDAVLKMVASAIRGVMREEEMAARYGGEEFAAVLPGIAPEGLSAIAERVRAAVEKATLERAGAILSVTISVGGICIEQGAVRDGTSDLIEAADRLMYQAKHAGRNRCCIATGA